MKKTLFTVFLNISLFFVAFSQTYHPLIKENKTWEVFWFSSQNLCLVDGANRYYFKGDTMINSVSYKILWANPFVQLASPPPCPPWAVDTSTSYIVQFLREDTITQKIFIVDQSNGNIEDLLFDFTLNIGDTLNSSYLGLGETLVIDTIEIITLQNGETRRKWLLTNGHSYIESIGGSEQFYFPLITGLGWWYALSCVQENGSQLIGSQCSPILGIETILSEKKNVIYPTPIDEYFFIERKEAIIETLVIFDATGKISLSKKLHSKFEKIDVSNLNSGIYFYIIGNVEKGKLIIN